MMIASVVLVTVGLLLHCAIEPKNAWDISDKAAEDYVGGFCRCTRITQDDLRLHCEPGYAIFGIEQNWGLPMECSDTGHLPAIRLEHIDIKTSKRLNRLVGILKSFFRGEGQITFVYSGGKVSRVRFETVDPNEEKQHSS